jgi:hypothetical protein
MVGSYMLENQVNNNDTLRRPQARDTGFYVPPETRVTSRGLERSGALTEVTLCMGRGRD